jgi:hypothetical protein
MMIYANQVAPGRAQTNPNDRNSKFDTAELVAGQTNHPSTVVSNYIITGRAEVAKRCDTTVLNVLAIEY